MSRQFVESTPDPGVTVSKSSAQPPSRFFDLSLYAAVPAAQHGQLIQLLAGVAGHPPNRLKEVHSIFKPNNIVTSRPAADQGGGSQTLQDNTKAAMRKRAHESFKEGQSWLMKAVESISLDYESSSSSLPGDQQAEQSIDNSDMIFSWRWSGLPDPNMKLVTGRSMQWSNIEPQDPVAYAQEKDYKLISQFALHGERFIHHNVVLLVHRLFRWPATGQDLRAFSFPEDYLLDKGGNYILEARLALADTTKNELTSKGIKELTQLRETLQGCVDLRPIDRLAADTRARA